LDVEVLKIKPNSQPREIERIEMDGHVIESIEIDKYNNFHAEIPNTMPLSYLSKFRYIFTDYIEYEYGYKHRSGIGFFIRYFEQHHESLSINDVLWMCQEDGEDVDKVDKGFKEWLIGNSYSSDGNLCSYKDWDYKIIKEGIIQEED